MRRRQISVARAATEQAHRIEQEQPPKEPTPTPKGECPKCGKHIGTGLYAHTLHCKGFN